MEEVWKKIIDDLKAGTAEKRKDAYLALSDEMNPTIQKYIDTNCSEFQSYRDELTGAAHGAMISALNKAVNNHKENVDLRRYFTARAQRAIDRYCNNVLRHELEDIEEDRER